MGGRFNPPPLGEGNRREAVVEGARTYASLFCRRAPSVIPAGRHLPQWGRI